MSTPVLRTFLEGDEFQLAALHHTTWHGCAGYVEKSPEQWKRLHVQHPDIGPERIIAATNGSGGIAGYAAWSRGCHPLFPRTDADGLIYDVCLDPSAGTRTAVALVHRCIADAAAAGVPRLACMAPANNRRVRAALQRWGFVDLDKGYVIGFLVTDPALMLNSRADAARQARRRIHALELELTQDFSDRIVPFGENGVLRVNVTGTGRPIRLRCGIVALTIMMMGGATPLSLLLRRQWLALRFTDIPAALITFNSLSTGLRFGMPMIDWR